LTAKPAASALRQHKRTRNKIEAIVEVLESVTSQFDVSGSPPHGVGVEKLK
jgi:hypothetical protein